MIQLAKPDLREDDIARAVNVLRSGMLVQGENVADFERELVDFTGLSFAVATSSGTAALHLALKAFGVGPGDAVLVPAFTFPATANVVEALGGRTILCDVSAESYVVNPQSIICEISANADAQLKAVIVVHEFGYPARIREIADACRAQGLILIEDAACALGAIADGRHVGHFSDAACFSFHPRKAITTGEGGAVISQSGALAEKVKMLRNHGIVATGRGVDFQDAGLNYRLTDFQAALALGQLHRFHAELQRRRELAKLYRQELEHVTGLALPEIPGGHSLQSFMIVLSSGFSRAKIISELHECGIQANLGAQALNCLSFYREKYGFDSDTCPVASLLYESGLVLPLYGSMQVDDVKYVCHTLRKLLKKS